jgi:tRNA G10  N-methylase Trm11
MRVPVPDLRGLIEDLFQAAATVLRPGGRLVLANPLSSESTHPSFQLRFRQAVDFGGFDCRLEMYQMRAG